MEKNKSLSIRQAKVIKTLSKRVRLHGIGHFPCERRIGELCGAREHTVRVAARKSGLPLAQRDRHAALENFFSNELLAYENMLAARRAKLPLRLSPPKEEDDSVLSEEDRVRIYGEDN
jgi:hypothetical protein